MKNMMRGIDLEKINDPEYLMGVEARFGASVLARVLEHYPDHVPCITEETWRALPEGFLAQKDPFYPLLFWFFIKGQTHCVPEDILRQVPQTIWIEIIQKYLNEDQQGQPSRPKYSIEDLGARMRAIPRGVTQNFDKSFWLTRLEIHQTRASYFSSAFNDSFADGQKAPPSILKIGFYWNFLDIMKPEIRDSIGRETLVENRIVPFCKRFLENLSLGYFTDRFSAADWFGYMKRDNRYCLLAHVPESIREKWPLDYWTQKVQHFGQVGSVLRMICQSDGGFSPGIATAMKSVPLRVWNEIDDDLVLDVMQGWRAGSVRHDVQGLPEILRKRVPFSFWEENLFYLRDRRCLSTLLDDAAEQSVATLQKFWFAVKGKNASTLDKKMIDDLTPVYQEALRKALMISAQGQKRHLSL